VKNTRFQTTPRFVGQENGRRLEAHFVCVRGTNFHLLSKSDIILLNSVTTSNQLQIRYVISGELR
jgi:hypothetical protein